MKKRKPEIEFISTVAGLSSIEECVPKPSINFIPSWWKEMKYLKHDKL